MLRAPRQLPGYRFEVQPPALDLSLPRMDIAAFVGFAARGPLHVPVVVEDVAQFTAIFGTDLPLAWDTETRQMTRALLPLAVRAFFRNGGQRCWVVRVADPKTAQSSVFPLAGMLMDVPGQTVLSPATVSARSPGSWADDLQVSCDLLVQAVRVEEVNLARNLITLRLDNQHTIHDGEMLRLTWGDSTQMIGVVSQIAPVNNQSALAGRIVRVRLTHVRWFSLARPPRFTGRGTAYTIVPGQAHTPLIVQPQGPESFGLLDYTVNQLPQAGSLIQIEGQLADGTRVPYWFRLTDVVDLRARFGSRTSRIDLYGVGVTQMPAPPSGLAPIVMQPRAEIIRTAVITRQRDDDPLQLSNLGLAPNHPRFIGALPDDQTYYGSKRPEAVRNFWDKAAGFPLIGEASAIYYPISVPLAREVWLPRLPVDARTALERDGLAVYTSQYFFDEGLANATVFNLIELADFIRYLSANPRRLTGMHTLLEIDEVTLVAAPDAVHRGWYEDKTTFSWDAHPIDPAATDGGFEVCSCQDIPRPEWVNDAPQPAFGGAFELIWQLDTSGLPDKPITYTLEEARHPDMSDAAAIYETTSRQTLLRLVRYGRPSGTYYYRVRARQGVVSSPYSFVCRVNIPEALFDVCSGLEIKHPEWVTAPTPDANGTFELVWQLDVSGLPDEPVTYTVEEARRPDARGAVVIYRITSKNQPLRYTLYGRSPGVYFYRVQAQQGALCSQYSLMLQVDITPPSRWRVYPSGDPITNDTTAQRLTDIQQKLLRMSAARGDLFAVLSLPGHYHEQEALSHVTRLQPFTQAALPVAPEIFPISQSEAASLTYGALYHPWAVGRESGDLVAQPPDGTVLGIMAKRARRGAWIAPASEEMLGVVALTPALSPDVQQRFLDAQVNLLRHEPRGFMTLSADTLGADPLLRPINVRRLLILLRRAALQRGTNDMFEPNDDALRRLLEREYEGLLDLLFRRGAFAGRTPAESYQVEVKNGQLEMDRGQVIIELRVAPSLPLVFLLVRLVQSGARITVQEGR
jgi:hypothetical protein